LANGQETKSNRKATEKKTETVPNLTVPMVCFVFCFLFFGYFGYEKCIEKTGILHAKIVPTGGSGGLRGAFFRLTEKPKRILASA
jgi:hypothetical protein